jgi:cbb3-type cytochrome oxidase subunit 3
MLKFVMTESGEVSLWGLFSLVFFFLIFVAICVWVLRPNARIRYQEVNQLPLEDGTLKEEKVNE